MKQLEFSKKTATGLTPVFADLFRGAKNHAMWSAFAVEELRNRYRHSSLGLIWIVLSFLILVFALAVFFGGMTSEDGRRFTIYLSFGLVGFQFLMGSLTDACTVFIRSASWIKSVRLPYSTYIYGAVLRGLLPFGIQLVTACIVGVLLGWRPTLHALFVIPALLVILFNTVWVYLFLGIISARYRDIQHFVASMGRFLFFATPIFWTYETQSPFVVMIANFNPLTHFLEIFRKPLLGEVPSDLNFIVVASLTIAGWVLALGTASVLSRRIPFWVT